MPNLRPCKTVCFYEATWGCDYPNTAGNGHLHFDGGNMNRFDVWNGTNWVAASFEPGSVIKVKRATPWQDVYYEIGANGTSFRVVTTEHVLNVCGRDAQEVSMSQHKVVLQRCVPEPEDCDKTCDCLFGAQEPEAISLSSLGELLAPVIFEEACFEAPMETSGCGRSESVYFFEESPGCWKLGIRSAEANRNYYGNAGNGDLAVAPNDTHIWPADFPANKYTRDQVIAADANGTGNLDENRLRGNIVSTLRETIPCNGAYDRTTRFSVISEPNIQNGYDAATTFVYRYRVDGGPWIWSRLASSQGDNVLAMSTPFNSLSRVYEISNTIGLPAGEVEYQLLAFQVGNIPARFYVQTYPTSSGRTNGPSMLFSPTG